MLYLSSAISVCCTHSVIFIVLHMPKHARWRLGPGLGLGPLAGPARLAQASATTELVYTGALIWGVGIYWVYTAALVTVMKGQYCDGNSPRGYIPV